MGVNLDNPIGKPDSAEYALRSSDASRSAEGGLSMVAWDCA
jgi:hypothetical protein